MQIMNFVQVPNSQSELPSSMLRLRERLAQGQESQNQFKEWLQDRNKWSSYSKSLQDQLIVEAQQEIIALLIELKDLKKLEDWCTCCLRNQFLAEESLLLHHLAIVKRLKLYEIIPTQVSYCLLVLSDTQSAKVHQAVVRLSMLIKNVSLVALALVTPFLNNYSHKNSFQFLCKIIESKSLFEQLVDCYDGRWTNFPILIRLVTALVKAGQNDIIEKLKSWKNSIKTDILYQQYFLQRYKLINETFLLNSKPKDYLKFKTENDLTDMLQFIRTNRKLNHAKIVGLLGSDHQLAKRLLSMLLDQCVKDQLTVEQTLRVLMKDFLLVGDSDKVQKITDALVQRLLTTKGGGKNPTLEIYTIFFSLKFINSQQEGKRISLKEFIKILGDTGRTQEQLTLTYQRISRMPMVAYSSLQTMSKMPYQVWLSNPVPPKPSGCPVDFIISSRTLSVLFQQKRISRQQFNEYLNTLKVSQMYIMDLTEFCLAQLQGTSAVVQILSRFQLKSLSHYGLQHLLWKSFHICNSLSLQWASISEFNKIIGQLQSYLSVFYNSTLKSDSIRATILNIQDLSLFNLLTQSVNQFNVNLLLEKAERSGDWKRWCWLGWIAVSQIPSLSGLKSNMKRMQQGGGVCRKFSLLLLNLLNQQLR